MLNRNELHAISKVTPTNRRQTSSPSSLPHTPTYQSSNLNPNTHVRNKNRPIISQTSEQLEYETKFKELKIVKIVDRFEENINMLSQKVTSFQTEDLANVVSFMIDINDELNVEIEKLEKHRLLKQTIDELQHTKQELTTESKLILRRLLEFRSQLKQLPKLTAKPSALDESIASVDIEQVLKYGLKLSKFTRVPPSSNGAAAPHPNNFIWPAEDSLRRGMLAMSSLKSDQIIQKELGIESANPKEPETTNMADSKPSSGKQPLRAKPKEKLAPATLDIDLFDPQDSDSD